VVSALSDCLERIDRHGLSRRASRVSCSFSSIISTTAAARVRFAASASPCHATFVRFEGIFRSHWQERDPLGRSGVRSELPRRRVLASRSMTCPFPRSRSYARPCKPALGAGFRVGEAVVNAAVDESWSQVELAAALHVGLESGALFDRNERILPPSSLRRTSNTLPGRSACPVVATRRQTRVLPTTRLEVVGASPGVLSRACPLSN